ncbi:GNAT-family acetyltransferase [Oligella ureolytica]|uniref:GNAT family N-acetyltransferase n=1 Tax=Oligella ureolytica TaxID=90244 RepID=UPI000E07DCA4|nr:GNAT family N-acetyltransferase [Oligella ureolytica]SUA59277.1 GNAT-family acetyltransferase [Oligella ureolytica]
MLKILRKFKSYLTSKKNHRLTQAKLNDFTEIETLEQDRFVVRAYSSSDENSVSKLYEQLNKIPLSKAHKNLYQNSGSKLLFVATDKKNNQVMGIDMFYFNPRDFNENTVHEGFIGVLPEYQGQGIATIMRKQAIKHFKENRLAGISTRISKNNLGSLYSAEKLGFKPVDEYYDEAMDEQRYYLVCNL